MTTKKGRKKRSSHSRRLKREREEAARKAQEEIDNTPPPDPSLPQYKPWSAQPGPQADAIAGVDVDEMLFGGARGGGKTAFLLGDYLQDVQRYGPNWQGVLFRRTTNELQEVIRQSQEMFGLIPGIRWFQQRKEWHFPEGAILRMRWLEYTRDAARYQGHQYCVGVSTPILMADGTHRRIGEIRPGDFVQTLSGPKAVLHAIEPYLADCVRLTNQFGSQIQPKWHPVLSQEGWRSYNDLTTSSERPASSEPYISSLESTRVGSRLLSAIRSALQQAQVLEQRILAGSSSLISGGGASCALSGSGISAGSLFHYSPYFHQYDELFRNLLESDPGGTPSQADVALSCLAYYTPDVAGDIPSHSHLSECSYEHPYYSGKVLSATEGSFCVPCDMSPCGEAWVTDISVADVNHYISADTRVANRNTWIAWDELTNWPTMEAYDQLKACLRWTAAEVPTKRIRATANPGGPGHHAVREYFLIDQYPKGFHMWKCPATHMNRVFVPSRVTDNKILLEKDPNYVARLKGTGSPELVRAWLEGDWDAVLGGFFPEFKPETHVTHDLPIPAHWVKFRAIDWGSASPFSVGWFAVSDGSNGHGGSHPIPKNAIILYREWYGASKANVGLKMDAGAVADGILARTPSSENVVYTVADPSMFSMDGGPSIAERMAGRGLNLRPGDNTRITGWDAVRGRLLGEDNKPLLFVDASCTDTIRSLPALQHDANKPEDCDTRGDDHCADMIRYACMSRPYSRKIAEATEAKTMHTMTYEDLINAQKPGRRRGRI